MLNSKGNCVICGRPKYGLNKKGICPDCQYFLRHGKTKLDVKLEKIKLRKKKVKFKKATGEKDLFLKIWQEREHVCSNCKCSLGDEPVVHFFSHIKSKGAYPELRLCESNIELLCLECHHFWDNGSKEKFYNKKRGV